jgi:drug/metabolite transporter (DMT)-like permease
VSKELKAHIALFIVGLIYGLNYLIAKDVMKGYIEPRGFILLRVVGASLLFWLFHANSKNEKIDRKDYWRIALCGLTGVALNQMMFFEGLNMTTAINASIIMTSSPIIVLLLSAITFKERLTPAKLIGIGLGAIGAVYLIAGGHNVSLLDENKSLGNLFIFINATSYSIYLILVKPLMAKYNALTVIKWVFLMGFIYVLPFGYGQLSEVQWSTMSIKIILEVTFVVVCTTFIAYLFNVYALKTVSSTVVSSYIYLQPFFATTTAVLLKVEELIWPQVVAAAFIFAGVYLVSFNPFQRRKETAPSS